jgi:DNA-binding winged helix-turn-helix (wHTH) protein/tetratricopeptide (TPR) repeat protein
MDALQGLVERPLTADALAARDDFTLGEASVSPSTRRVSGPGGSAEVEPRVMQVLLVLADAGGRVVSRTVLFQRCWGGVHVGDDSLNRTIGVIRKLAAEIAGESFSVETVRRTGYRLNVVGGSPAARTAASAGSQGGQSRRLFIAGSAAALAAAGGTARWLARPQSHSPFDALIERGQEALRYGSDAKYREAETLFRQAAALKPRDATAWGLLAYTQVAMSSDAPGDAAGRIVETAERSARTALALDPANPDAQVTMVLIHRSFADRATIEDALRAILASSPDNPRAMAWLDRLLQGAGRTEAAWKWNERLIALEPLSPWPLLRKGLKLWVFERIAEAQDVSQQTMEWWPSNPLVRMARLLICAFTGRTQEALILVQQEEARPLLLSAQGVAVWRASLKALESPSRSNIDGARQANVEGAKSSPALAAYGLLVMSELGDLDTAFDIANGSLLSRGPIVVGRNPVARPAWINGPGWRNTLGLFTPPARAMRLNARFATLSGELGLTDYWRRRAGPDAYLFRR